MSSDLIALVIAISLGVVVVAVGLRRNLGDATRAWLPPPGDVPDQASATLGLADGGRRRHPLSPWERRRMVWAYLLICLCNVAIALASASDRWWHALFAALWAFGAVAFWRKWWPRSVGEST